MFPAALDYNPNLPMAPDTATWEGAILLTREVFAVCRKHRPDWAMSFECNWDRMLEFTGSTWWVGNQLITRQVFPEQVETLGLYEAYDYLGVNNAVRDGHQVMVAPLNFCRSLDWPPFRGLATYIKEVKRIRDSLQETVFYGEVLGRSAARFRGTPPAGFAYNVFRNRENGRRVCVMTESSREAGRVSFLGFEGQGGRRARLHAPFERTRQVRLPVAVEVPAERIVFLEELDDPAPARHARTELAAPPLATARAGQGSGGGTKGPGGAAPINGGFESGDFTGWTADSNWVVVDNSCGYYSGWHGRYWAWSGGKGEPAMGILRSKPFVLDHDAVRLLISGWNSISGTGTPRRWNYVTLSLEDGRELDRVYAPNTTSFVPVYLDGSGYRGRKVVVQAVDDADQATYSMLCLDDVRTVALPGDLQKPVPVLPRFDARRSLKLENARCLVEVSRANGSVTRIRDKETGLDLILEPRLAGSYKFALPIAGKEPWQTLEANWILGREQRLTGWQLEGQKLSLRWKGPLQNYLGEAFAVGVTETIELRAAGLLFNLEIENASGCSVGEVYFPMLGGLQGLGRTRGQLKATTMVRPRADGACATADIFRVFGKLSWLGDQGPEQFYAVPKDQPEPWVGFESQKIDRSLCLGALDSSNRTLVIRLELVPASSGTLRDDGNWPRLEELRGLPAGVELSFVDIANCPAPRTYHATPVFLEFLSGGGPEMRKAHGRCSVERHRSD